MQTPCYRSLRDLPAALGARVVDSARHQKNGWIPDLDVLKTALAEKTRAVVVNFPHNPTGALPDKDTFGEIVRLCEDHGAVLFSDEVYRFLEYDPADRLPAACDLSETAVSLGVMSKSFGLAGLRVGLGRLPQRPGAVGHGPDQGLHSICGSPAYGIPGRPGPAQQGRGAVAHRAITLGNLVAARTSWPAGPKLFSWSPPTAGPIAFPRLTGDGECPGLLLPASFGHWRAFAARPGLRPVSRSFPPGIRPADFTTGLAELDSFLDREGSARHMKKPQFFGGHAEFIDFYPCFFTLIRPNIAHFVKKRFSAPADTSPNQSPWNPREKTHVQTYRPDPPGPLDPDQFRPGQGHRVRHGRHLAAHGIRRPGQGHHRFAVDYMKAAGKEARIQPVFKAVAWTASSPVSTPATTTPSAPRCPSPTNAKTPWTSPPVFQGPPALVVPKASSAKTIDDMKGKTLARRSAPPAISPSRRSRASRTSPTTRSPGLRGPVQRPHRRRGL